MAENNTPHRLSPRPFSPSSPSTDEDRADWVSKTRAWRENIESTRHWELPNLVRNALRELGVEAHINGLHEFEKVVQRVTRIIRSRRSKKGAAKRRDTVLKKRQGNLFE